VFRQLRQPQVIGEILAGAVIGPAGLALIGGPGHGEPDPFHLTFETLAELGAISLLFFVGLETHLDQMIAVGSRALVVAVAGVAVPLLTGYLFLSLLGEPTLEAVFLGAAMVATSVGITARVLHDLGALNTKAARVILGAAVADDVLGLLVLAVLSGVATKGSVVVLDVVVVAVEAAAFLVFVGLIGSRVVRRFHVHIRDIPLESGSLGIAAIAMLVLAAVASRIGLAGIVGAFLAGMMLSEARERFQIEEAVRPLYQFLAPFFFVFVGSQVDFRAYGDLGILGTALAVTVLAILTKFLPCTLAALGMGWHSAAVVGAGMVPRGEVGFIVAGLGLSLGIVPQWLYSDVVLMSILTTLLAPYLLQFLYRARKPSARHAAGG
jgi:Kef-type K+ transport system membrane component KefB